MHIILCEKIANLGELGAQVEVRSGYGRNYLIPTGRAVPATQENIKLFEAKLAELERQRLAGLQQAKERAEQLTGLAISIAKQAGPEGKLFGSVGASDIIKAVMEHTGVSLEKHELRLADGPIRKTGDYLIDLQLHKELSLGITLNIVAAED